MSEVEIVKGTAFELDPSKTYLICFDSRTISPADVASLAKKLKLSNGSVAIMLNGDANTAVKVVEAKSD